MKQYWYRTCSSNVNWVSKVNFLLLSETRTLIKFEGQIKLGSFRFKHPYTSVSEEVTVCESFDDAKEKGALTMIEVFDIEPYMLPSFK